MAEMTVTTDDLVKWNEDALTQGIAPATYVFRVLRAALIPPEVPASPDTESEDGNG